MRAAGGVAEGTLCYTGDVSDPNAKKYTLEYYLDLAGKQRGGCMQDHEASRAFVASKDCGSVRRAPACWLARGRSPCLPGSRRPAEKMADHGIHTLAIKDMAGLLKPRAATQLVGALRERFPDIPIHV